MYERLVLIKFGGSLITDKARQDTARMDAIEFCADELKEARDASPDTHFIVGTGAGSFGHIQAHKYKLREGATATEQFYGMCTIHNNVRKLNELVVDQLTDRGLPAFSLSPSALFVAHDGTVSDSFFQPVTQLLASGCMPLLHGDAVLDPVRGVTIMSTEKVLQTCLEHLRNMYREVIVVYCMDTAGLLDESHETVPILEREEELFAHQSDVKDVTGGISGKVKSARRAAQIADRVYLVSGKEAHALVDVIEDKQVGTRVL